MVSDELLDACIPTLKCLLTSKIDKALNVLILEVTADAQKYEAGKTIGFDNQHAVDFILHSLEQRSGLEEVLEY